MQELLKLRKKITSTVQVLTHLKEKLQYVQAENQVQKRNLREVEAEVGQVMPLFNEQGGFDGRLLCSIMYYNMKVHVSLS